MAVHTPATLAAHSGRERAAGVAAAAPAGELAGRASPTGLKRDLEGAGPSGARQRPKVSAPSADTERTDSETLSD